MKTTKSFLSILSMALLAGCYIPEEGSLNGGASSLMVDLNDEGNAKLKADAEKFRKQLEGETAFLQNEKLPRVLIQGYGAFQGTAREDNASYQVVNQSFDRFVAGQGQRINVDGAEMETGIGVVNGKRVRMFRMINDVNPAAAAYIAHSRNIIKPNFTLSSGQATESRVERFSTNVLTDSVGSYDAQGNADPLMSQQGTRIDESRPEGGLFPPQQAPVTPRPTPLPYVPSYPTPTVDTTATSNPFQQTTTMFTSFLPTDSPAGTLVPSSGQAEKVASSMNLPLGSETTGGTYMCNLAKLTNDYHDQGMDLQLTKDYLIPSKSGSGTSAFVHWAPTSNMGDEQRESEMASRIGKVESAISTSLSNEPIDMIANMPESISVNETPSGLPAGDAVTNH